MYKVFYSTTLIFGFPVLFHKCILLLILSSIFVYVFMQPNVPTLHNLTYSSYIADTKSIVKRSAMSLHQQACIVKPYRKRKKCYFVWSIIFYSYIQHTELAYMAELIVQYRSTYNYITNL